MLELVVKRLRLVAVDVINNLAHGIVNSFRSVGDVVVGHVRPGVPDRRLLRFEGSTPHLLANAACEIPMCAIRASTLSIALVLFFGCIIVNFRAFIVKMITHEVKRC